MQIKLVDHNMEQSISWGQSGEKDKRLEKLCVRIRQDSYHPIVECLGLKVFDVEQYDEPETELDALRMHSKDCAPGCTHKATDFLLKPVSYTVLQAGAPEEIDEHEASTKLRHERMLSSANSYHGGSEDADAELAADEGGKIHEELGKTLCYRYRTDTDHNGWMSDYPPRAPKEESAAKR